MNSWTYYGSARCSSFIESLFSKRNRLYVPGRWWTVSQVSTLSPRRSSEVASCAYGEAEISGYAQRLGVLVVASRSPADRCSRRRPPGRLDGHPAGVAVEAANLNQGRKGRNLVCNCHPEIVPNERRRCVGHHAGVLGREDAGKPLSHSGFQATPEPQRRTLRPLRGQTFKADLLKIVTVDASPLRSGSSCRTNRRIPR